MKETKDARQERIKAAMNYLKINEKRLKQFDHALLTHKTRARPISVPKFVEIKGGMIIDPYFLLPRPVNLPNYKIAREPVTKAQYKSFLEVTGISKDLLGILLAEGEKWRRPYPHRWSPERDLNEFWNLAHKMSWAQSDAYCDFLNVTSKDFPWKYTIPSRAQWMQAFINNNAELIVPKDKFGDIIEEWTSDLSGEQPGPIMNNTYSPLPMSTMYWIPMVELARFNGRCGGLSSGIPEDSDIRVESSIIRDGSWGPNMDIPVFRPAQELVPSVSYL